MTSSPAGPLIRNRIVAGVQLVVAATLVACSSSTESDSAFAGRRLSVGEWTACALDRDGKVSCWGWNSTYYEYGSTTTPTPIPVDVPVPRLGRLSGGIAQHMCGLTLQREAVCWGRGGRGELGGGTAGATGNAATTVQLASVSWADIGVGRLTTCGVSTDGAGYCWGFNQRGELGDSALAPATIVSTPNRVIGGIQFASIVPGWIHTCGIATSGATYCWGDNTSGQLGIGLADPDPHPRPLLVSFTQAFKKLSLGARSTCGITTDNQLLCWGYNGTGQLGDGTTTTRSVPTPVATSVKFTDVSLGSGFAGGVRPEVILPTGLAQGGIAHGCGVSVPGQVYCWGWNGAGQVGEGSTTTQPAPVPIASTKKMFAVAVGGAYSCAIGETALWCWGSNALGQLGNGSYTDSSVPVSVLFQWP